MTINGSAHVAEAAVISAGALRYFRKGMDGIVLFVRATAASAVREQPLVETGFAMGELSI
ncbi:hypothetical protein MZC58_14720 [Crossiella sp. S99.1]|nr:hypothetical protein [Crossiella sp. S99.1]